MNKNNDPRTTTEAQNQGLPESLDSGGPPSACHSRDALLLQSDSSKEPLAQRILPRLDTAASSDNNSKCDSQSSRKRTHMQYSSPTVKVSTLRSPMGQWVNLRPFKPGQPVKRALPSLALEPYQCGRSSNAPVTIPSSPAIISMAAKSLNWRSNHNGIGSLAPWSDPSHTPHPVPKSPTTPEATANLSPYPVTRYTLGQGRIQKIESQLSQPNRKSVTPNDLAVKNLVSGDIITMCAALQQHGFTKADKTRWFLILGRLLVGHDYVVAPLTTFGGKGKSGLESWKQEWFRYINKASSAKNVPSYEDEGIDCSDDILDFLDDEGYSSSDENNSCNLSSLNVLKSTHPVFSENYPCHQGSIVPLATAFIIRPDSHGCISASFSGYLTPDSFDDLWECLDHLRVYHEEAGYLFETNLGDWNFEHARTLAKCRESICHLGTSLKF